MSQIGKHPLGGDDDRVPDEGDQRPQVDQMTHSRAMNSDKDAVKTDLVPLAGLVRTARAPGPAPADVGP